MTFDAKRITGGNPAKTMRPEDRVQYDPLVKGTVTMGVSCF